MRIRRTIELVLSDERLITPSGLTIVGNMLSRSEFVQYFNLRRDIPKRSEHQIPNGDIVLTFIGLLTQGKPQFDSVNEMQNDPEYYRMALGLKRGLPSSATLRQRMDVIGRSARKAILNANVNMFTAHGIAPGALAVGIVWKCQVLCSLKTHKNQFGIGTEQLDRYLSSFCAVREGRKFSRRGLCRAGSVVA